MLLCPTEIWNDLYKRTGRGSGEFMSLASKLFQIWKWLNSKIDWLFLLLSTFCLTQPVAMEMAIILNFASSSTYIVLILASNFKKKKFNSSSSLRSICRAKKKVRKAQMKQKMRIDLKMAIPGDKPDIAVDPNMFDIKQIKSKRVKKSNDCVYICVYMCSHLCLYMCV